MRAAAILLLLATAAACGERRSFDERYDDTAANIQDRVNRLDAQLNEAEGGEAKPAP